MKKEVVLTVRVAPEIKDIIDSIAQKDDRTVAWITRSLITEALQARKLLNWFLLTTTRQPKKLIPYSCAESPGSLRIEKYRKSRYWSVWVGQELLAVTVYKKGAVAIKNILSCEGVGEV